MATEALLEFHWNDETRGDDDPLQPARDEKRTFRNCAEQPASVSPAPAPRQVKYETRPMYARLQQWTMMFLSVVFRYWYGWKRPSGTAAPDSVAEMHKDCCY